MCEKQTNKNLDKELNRARAMCSLISLNKDAVEGKKKHRLCTFSQAFMLQSDSAKWILDSFTQFEPNLAAVMSLAVLIAPISDHLQSFCCSAFKC